MGAIPIPDFTVIRIILETISFSISYRFPDRFFEKPSLLKVGPIYLKVPNCSHQV
jgi:hypothetical protein